LIAAALIEQFAATAAVTVKVVVAVAAITLDAASAHKESAARK
jgi:hypothetical protein